MKENVRLQTQLGFVGGGIHQAVRFGGVGHFYFDNPAFAIRIVVDKRRVGLQLFVELQDFPAHRHENGGYRLHRFDGTELLFLVQGLAHGGDINEDDVAQFNGDIILVEIQQTEEYYYLQRILYGVAKAVTEHITLGERYAKVKKVYSINIVYFDLGKGSDYLYHGQTKFRGVNTGDRLEITEKERNGIRLLSPENVFPEYYILRLKSFNKEPENPMEEWMEYLKSGRIRPDTTTPGLQEAKRRLDFLKMSPQEQRIYEKYLDDRVYEEDVLTTSKEKGERIGERRGFKKGHAEGLQEGLEKGRAEERIAIAAKMKQPSSSAIP